MPGRLEGKICIITGAGAGIGRACAREFVTEGARVVLNDIDGDRLDSVVAELGDAATGRQGDVTDRTDVESLIEQAHATHGRVDVLYNNAAFGFPGTLLADIDDAAWRAQQQVCVDSVFFGMRAVIPLMAEQGGGSIVTMSSGAGIGGEWGLGAYAAHKAAVISLTQTVAMEYGRQGIRANAVTPGPTATEPLRAWVDSRPGGEAEFAADLNLARLSQPPEVAKVVAFLASDDSAVVTGMCIQCNIRAKKRPRE